MGLDMYMDKVKRVNGATLDEILTVEKYFDYVTRPEKYRETTMKEWCGVEESKVNMNITEQLIGEYYHKYATWDTEHKYGFNRFTQEVAYWRKANAIHKWFVDNIQDGIDDCGNYEVTKEDLEELLHVCKLVKNESRLVKGRIKNGETLRNGKWVVNYEDGEYIADSSTAMELLPTTEGFFFGSTAYDQWYMEDIDYTIKQLEKILKETDFDNWIVFYTSSW